MKDFAQMIMSPHPGLSKSLFSQRSQVPLLPRLCSKSSRLEFIAVLLVYRNSSSRNISSMFTTGIYCCPFQLIETLRLQEIFSQLSFAHAPLSYIIKICRPSTVSETALANKKIHQLLRGLGLAGDRSMRLTQKCHGVNTTVDDKSVCRFPWGVAHMKGAMDLYCVTPDVRTRTQE